MKKPRRPQPREMPTPPIQAMGGKEERVSSVGRARAEAEKSEAQGDVRFDLAPGPGTDELLHGRRRPASSESPTKLRRRKVSPEPRGGPVGPEPEIVQPARRRKPRRPPESLPFEHDEGTD